MFGLLFLFHNLKEIIAGNSLKKALDLFLLTTLEEKFTIKRFGSMNIIRHCLALKTVIRKFFAADVEAEFGETT